jgi:hypothetical protein
VASAVRPLAASGARPRAALGPNSIGTDLTLEPSSGGGKRVTRDLFVDMHGLGMLSQVIQAGEAPRTVTLERPLPRMFPDMPCQVLTPGEAQIAGRKVCAIEPLTLLLFGRGSVVTTRLGLMVWHIPISIWFR